MIQSVIETYFIFQVSLIEYPPTKSKNVYFFSQNPTQQRLLLLHQISQIWFKWSFDLIFRHRRRIYIFFEKETLFFFYLVLLIFLGIACSKYKLYFFLLPSFTLSLKFFNWQLIVLTTFLPLCNLSFSFEMIQVVSLPWLLKWLNLMRSCAVEGKGMMLKR